MAGKRRGRIPPTDGHKHHRTRGGGITIDTVRLEAGCNTRRRVTGHRACVTRHLAYRHTIYQAQARIEHVVCSWQIVLQKSEQEALGVRKESEVRVRRIEVALPHSEANQYCALQTAKSFCNSICQQRTSTGVGGWNGRLSPPLGRAYPAETSETDRVACATGR